MTDAVKLAEISVNVDYYSISAPFQSISKEDILSLKLQDRHLFDNSQFIDPSVEKANFMKYYQKEAAYIRKMVSFALIRG
jgi:hypothetical protein